MWVKEWGLTLNIVFERIKGIKRINVFHLFCGSSFLISKSNSFFHYRSDLNDGKKSWIIWKSLKRNLKMPQKAVAMSEFRKIREYFQSHANTVSTLVQNSLRIACFLCSKLKKKLNVKGSLTHWFDNLISSDLNSSKAKRLDI